MAHKLLRPIHALVWPTSDGDVQDHQKNSLSFGLKFLRFCLKPQTNSPRKYEGNQTGCCQAGG